jgi:flagellar motor component MotA
LRLLHTPIPAKTVDAYVEQPYFPAASYSLALAEWLDTLSGVKEAMSKEIETNVKNSLIELCELVEQDAEEGLLSLETKRSRLKESSDGSNEGMDAVKRLWESQRRIGKLVASSVIAGTAF